MGWAWRTQWRVGIAANFDFGGLVLGSVSLSSSTRSFTCCDVAEPPTCHIVYVPVVCSGRYVDNHVRTACVLCDLLILRFQMLLDPRCPNSSVVCTIATYGSRFSVTDPLMTYWLLGMCINTTYRLLI